MPYIEQICFAPINWTTLSVGTADTVSPLGDGEIVELTNGSATAVIYFSLGGSGVTVGATDMMLTPYAVKIIRRYKNADGNFLYTHIAAQVAAGSGIPFGIVTGKGSI